jgi:hypothetical protein
MKHSGELLEHLSNVQAVEERQSADRQIDVLIRPEQMPEIAFKGSPREPDSHGREHPGRPACRSTIFGEGGQRPGTVQRNGGYERCRGRSRRQRLKRIFGRGLDVLPVLSLYLRGCVAFPRMAAMASTSSSCPAATLITRS